MVWEEICYNGRTELYMSRHNDRCTYFLLPHHHIVQIFLNVTIFFIVVQFLGDKQFTSEEKVIIESDLFLTTQNPELLSHGKLLIITMIGFLNKSLSYRKFHNLKLKVWNVNRILQYPITYINSQFIFVVIWMKP